MNKLKALLLKNRESLNTRTAQVGGYSFVMAVILLAILIALNVAVSSLPSTWTHYDISSTQLYSVTSSTKAVAQQLNDDVEIYWITQDGEEDTYIEKLLDVYGALSDHITVQKVNPDVYPTFASQYTDETVSNNSLIVVSGSRSRYIAYSDLYSTEYDYSTYSATYYFEGEAVITPALNYVTSEDFPVLYLLTGHGESDLTDSFTSALTKQNIETEEFSLLTVDEIPEDADAVVINAPTSDLSEDEVSMLQDYLDNGGHLLVISGPQEDDDLTNLHALLENYGITVEEGIVIEGNRDNYALGYAYMLLPNLEDSDITSELSDNNNYIIMSISQGLAIGTASSDDVTVTALLTTSDDAYSKIAGYELTTYDKEDDDIDGPFTLAVSVEDSASGGTMIWIGSDEIMADAYVSYSSGANSDFVMNAISWLIGETDSISIRSKSLSYSYLTISTSQGTVIKVCMVLLIPLCYLLYGVEDMIRRRRRA